MSGIINIHLIDKIDKSLSQGLIKALTETLKSDLWGIVLFGSRARGEGKSFSDWDVFIIADGVPQNPVDRTMFLRDLFSKKGIKKVSPIVRTREEFEKSLRPLYLDIAWDGIILFDQEGYVELKIKEIRKIIEKSGLQRRKKRGGWVWEWERPPEPGKWELEWGR